MSDVTFEKMKVRVSEDLSARVREFRQTIEEIGRNFRNLGLGVAVWHPEKVYGADFGGLDAECYIGYSRIEGKWGLTVRTIERDRETRAFVAQRVYTLESSSNMELAANALRRVPELMRLIRAAADRQIGTMDEIRGEFDRLRSPDCSF